MTTVISLNGADNVGKSTQIRWLATAIEQATSCGTIDRWHARWARLATGDFARWWFRDSSTAEHVGLVFDSHAQRRALTRGPMRLEDRGWPMLVATCAATAAVRDRLTPLAALAAVEEMVADYPSELAVGVHVLLRHSDDPQREAELALAREPRQVSPWYVPYQRALAEVLHIQVERGDYALAVVRADRPIGDVQHDIRAGLASRGAMVRRLAAPPERVWVLAGLSESGKSTIGELLRDEHGVTRLKIGYLLEVAATRIGDADPYAKWNEFEQAEHLAEELSRLAEATRASTVSLESAHRFEATRHLRRILGGRCQIVYAHADEERRLARAAEPAASVRERDRVKIDRGAARLASEAEWVLDNSGDLAALKLAVAHMVWLADHPSHAAGPKPAGCGPLREWLSDIVSSWVDPEVAAIIATGSTNTDQWVPDWSDIDLLVVRDSFPAEGRRLAHDPTPSGARVAVTQVTTGDVRAGRLPPRLVHTLRQLVADPSRVLYRREGFVLPIPTPDDDDRASRGELPVVVMRLRRLLAAEEPDVRAIHKHIVLVMRILLRAGNRSADTHEEITSAFAEVYGQKTTPPAPSTYDDPDFRAATIAAAWSVLETTAGLDQILVRRRRS